jgi:4-deoxy-L-threo-5-hexosulose-uronate ketol-isomerase
MYASSPKSADSSRESCNPMKTLLLADPVRFPRMTTREIRESFLMEGLSQPGKIHLTYVDLDRAVVGFAVPADEPLQLNATPELRAKFFTERRELGALNVGGEGLVHVGSSTYPLGNLDLIYIGRDNPEIRFETMSKESPAAFYILSYPAHTSHPVAVVKKGDAQPTETGSAAQSNRRTIYKYVHADGARSCQLVMGVTHLHEGSTWNTMPAHRHMRRSEVYCYFDVEENARVFHFMGPPEETRHIVMSDREIVVSPGWSIHAGAGTQSYKFCWGMGGENQDYADMDPVKIADMR